MNEKPPVQPGSRLALLVDQRGLWVYGNKEGLTSLAQRLLRIAQADPNECYECHTRMELGDTFGLGGPGDVALIVDEELRNYFYQLDEDAPVDAIPCGFELTFMHINETALGELIKQALENPAEPEIARSVLDLP